MEPRQLGKCHIAQYLISSNLANMQYIFIVALEFLIAFGGVALLVRYYNHNA